MLVDSYQSSQKAQCQWRMLPGLFTLTLSISAFVYSFFILKQKYVSIAPGAGAVTSLYLIYLGHSYHQLHSYEENNEKLSDEVVKLAIENVRLNEEVNRLQSLIDEFQESIQTLNAEITRLKDINDQLSLNISSLNHSVQKLKHVEQTLASTTEKHNQKFTEICKSFEKLFDNASEQNHDVSEMLAEHHLLVKDLEGLAESFLNTNIKTHESYKQQLALILKMNQVANLLLTALDKCKNLDKVLENLKALEQVTNQIKEQQTLFQIAKKELEDEKKHYKDLEEKAHQKELQLKEFEGNLTHLEEKIQSLELIKDSLEKNLKLMAEKIEKLDNEADDLKKIKDELKILVNDAKQHQLGRSRSMV